MFLLLARRTLLAMLDDDADLLTESSRANGRASAAWEDLLGGLERGRALPVGTITLLMADVEGSVRRWEANAEAARAAFARLDQIVDDAAARHDGARPLQQGEGDSFVVTFARPTDAVKCALDLQLAFAREAWPSGLDMRVRMALHTGEVDLRGGRYAGHAFNRCARIRALAHGGQTLLSRATSQLVADALPTGVTLLDLGEHRLRDLGRPERIHQLSHRELPSTFPPLSSLSLLPNNLPQQLTSFIGREDELGDVRRLLGETRMLTLTGAGGCGKTRLAAHVAASLLDEYPEGAWWIDLAPVADPALVLGTVAGVLSALPSESERLDSALFRRLADKRALLVFDNCEHLVDACAELVTTLMHRCPNVSILATSREPLGVEGEVSFRVPSLEQDDARKLFGERATHVLPNFKLTEENRGAIDSICARLEGIPLAIELAAARVRVLSPAQISQGLSDRFHLLTGGARTALPRQRTLEASVDWSYHLLNADEQTLLARLSVFAGGFGLEAAEDVGSGGSIERYRVLDMITSLVDKSLVQKEEVVEEARYRMLETIRVYARLKLADSGEANEVRARHLDHYVALVERAAPELEGPTLAAWWNRLTSDLDNLLAAMDFGLVSGAPDKTVLIGVTLGSMWVARGGAAAADHVYARMETALESPNGDPHVRAAALARLAFGSRDVGTAVQWAEQSVALSRTIADDRSLQLGLTALGWYGFWLGRSDCVRHLDEALELARTSGSARLLLQALHFRGTVEGARSGHTSAKRFFAEEMELARRSGDPFWLCQSGRDGAWWPVIDGHLDEAQSMFTAALEAARTLKSGYLVASVLHGLGFLAVQRGDYEDAWKIAEEARALQEEKSYILERVLIWLEIVTGELDAAARRTEDHIAVIEADLNPNSYIHCGLIGQRGWIAHLAGDLELARAQFDEALERSRKAGLRYQLGWLPFRLGRLARDEGDIERAENLLHEALQVSMECGELATPSDTIEALAGIAAVQESYREAARLFAAAQRARDKSGYARYPVDRPGYDQDLSSARAALEPQEFEAAWAEGANLSLEEASAYARRGRGERKRPSAGWASLTPAEMQVVKLVAEGLLNPEIASRLFVSRNTVKVHLQHVFGKLGISNRAELAAEATRRGI